MKSKIPTSAGYNALTFFWIATFNDGTALPQFDPETGDENLFTKVDQSKLESFGWYPFTRELADKIKYQVKLKPWLPRYVIHLHDGEQLVQKKTQFIPYVTNPFQELGRRTVHVLGIENGLTLHIDEDGNVEVK